jgi:hypothetical protein
MSWLFSQALVAEYSAANSSAGAPSVLSSASPTPQAYSSPDRMTAFSRLSRFGMMFAPLTDDHGEAVLTWFLAGFLAKTSARQGKERALTEPEADFGARWLESFARWDRASSSWKTPQCSLLADLDVFSETWPRWGMMRAGECSEQSMPVLRTSETESGLWGTPRVGMARGGNFWYDRGKHNLEEQVGAAEHAKMWPTLVSRMWKDSGSPSEYNRNEVPLAAQVGGQLNPTWVEWLMGWPLGWTDLKPLETDKFQQWLLQHGKY